MKIKSYFPRFYAVFLFVLLVTYCIIGYVFVSVGLPIGILVLIIIYLGSINMATLYEDKARFVAFYRFSTINFDMIESIEMDVDSNDGLSKGLGLQVIIFYTNTNKKVKFISYLYSKKTTVEIIKTAINKNESIQLNAKMRQFLELNEK